MSSPLTAPAEVREFEFDSYGFERVRRLIHRHAGISLNAGKTDMVYSRLSRRLRALGLHSFGAYLDRLEAGGGDEWQAFTNALTTNLTSFFREQHHFPLLAEHLRGLPPGGGATVWCAASATGEEPYSIAMALLEAARGARPAANVLASDIDTSVLATAAAGVYTEERVAGLTPERLRRFFLYGRGEHAGQVRVKPELHQLVTFRQVNLLAPAWPVGGPLAAIFCRNVMIYFDKPTQLRVLNRFAGLLAPGSLLFAGHSEHFQHPAFRLRGKSVYERVRGDGEPV